jgi:hypothetical protein
MTPGEGARFRTILSEDVRQQFRTWAAEADGSESATDTCRH